VSSAADETIRLASKTPSRVVIISVLGVTQIFAWGSSYYLPAVLAKPIAVDTGWSLPWVVGGLSLGLLIAGLVSPLVGRAIARRGGRPVLAVSAGLLAAGLSALALAHSLPAFLTAWLLVGLGMGAGLYDPAFATLGRLYGHGGRSAITTLTLFGGFASTVCWPLSAFLDAHLGWRGVCLVYAGFQLAVALPAYAFVLPREPQRPAPLPGSPILPTDPPRTPESQGGALFLLMAATITLSSMISTTLSVHLLTVLQAKGLTLVAAVGLGALVGPSQVAARAVEMVIARYHHPIWTKVASTSLVAAGLAALWIGVPIIPLALALYGAGIGLESIARGTLPLAVFGPERYPAVMGRIAMPSLIAQAAAPSIGTALIEAGGVDGAMGVFVAFASVNLVLAAGLFLMLRFSSRAIAIGLSTILVAHLAMPDEKLTTLKAVGLIAGEAGAGGRRAVLWD
jgi:MFS family permease